MRVEWPAIDEAARATRLSRHRVFAAGKQGRNRRRRNRLHGTARRPVGPSPDPSAPQRGGVRWRGSGLEGLVCIEAGSLTRKASWEMRCGGAARHLVLFVHRVNDVTPACTRMCGPRRRRGAARGLPTGNFCGSRWTRSRVVAARAIRHGNREASELRPGHRRRRLPRTGDDRALRGRPLRARGEWFTATCSGVGAIGPGTLSRKPSRRPRARPASAATTTIPSRTCLASRAMRGKSSIISPMGMPIEETS